MNNSSKSKVMSFLFIISLIISTNNTLAQTDIPAGNVKGVWSKSTSPYNINGEITIPNGETLTIEPGVEVIFTGHYKFNVQGRLLAIGSASDSISFTAQDPSTGWHGMRFINTPNTNDTSKIVYCSLKYGKANTGSDIDRCGGIFAIKNFSKVLISNCLFDFNMQYGSISTTGGGAIALWTASPIITNCEFKANTGVYGSVMAIYYSSNALIFNNHFHNNTGHGLINIGVNSASLLINNLIENNTSTAPAHGILHFEGGSSKAIFINNTIVNNNCGGGAVWESDGSTPLFINNIIYGNKPAQVRLEAPSALSFINCLIEDGQDGFKGSAFSGAYQNCIDVNPTFLSTNDFHLSDSSLCIGKGIDSIQISNKWYYTPQCDCEDNSRPNPKGSKPDIGAFENPLGSPLTGLIEGLNQRPDRFQLLQNYPNPFNPNTVISYQLPVAGDVTIKIFDVLGREVATLVDEYTQAGKYETKFNAVIIPSGIYFYQLKAGNSIDTKKMLLMK